MEIHAPAAENVSITLQYSNKTKYMQNQIQSRYSQTLVLKNSISTKLTIRYKY